MVASVGDRCTRLHDRRAHRLENKVATRDAIALRRLVLADRDDRDDLGVGHVHATGFSALRVFSVLVGIGVSFPDTTCFLRR